MSADPKSKASEDDITRILGKNGAKTPLPFKDAYEFMLAFFPRITPYRWQVEQLLQLSGYLDPYDDTSYVEPSKENPLLATLLAANGSGKDQIVLTIWALFCLTCKPNFYWIGTSSSYEQLNNQTWRHIEGCAQELNTAIGPRFLKINKHHISCSKSGSVLHLFRTDEGCKTEGWHPLVDGGGMAIVLNECKSLEPEVVLAFKQCHGYTHWLNISSPGDPLGYFYEKCVTPDVMWPKPLVLSKHYFRKVTVHDCPHLKAEFEREVPTEFALDHPYVQKSYLANFVSSANLRIIPHEALTYKYPDKSTLGLPRRAGLDLSLGGDATVLSVWEGNYFINEYEFRERHEPTLTLLLCAKIRELNIDASQIYADAGGSGTAIIQRIQEAGLNISGVHNQSKAFNKKVYKNRGSEMAMSFSRLITDKILNLEGLSSKLKRQMTERFYFVKDGLIQLESKIEFRARCGYSPDNFDAAILAHCATNIYTFNTKTVEVKSTIPANFKTEWEAIYGPINRDTKDRSLYRTSGVGRGRVSPARKLANY